MASIADMARANMLSELALSEPQGTLNDTFTRTVSSGWGAADTGDVWDCSGGAAADFSVDGSSGLISVTTLNASHICRAPVLYRDVDITAQLTPPVIPSGTSGHITYRIRARENEGNLYYLDVAFKDTGRVGIDLYKYMSSVLTSIALGVELFTFTANESYMVRFQVIGQTIRTKLWKAANVEPKTWNQTATNGELSRAGAAGLDTRIKAGNTDTLPMAIPWDNVRMVGIQTDIPLSNADLMAQVIAKPGQVLVPVTDASVGTHLTRYMMSLR